MESFADDKLDINHTLEIVFDQVKDILVVGENEG